MPTSDTVAALLILGEELGTQILECCAQLVLLDLVQIDLTVLEVLDHLDTKASFQPDGLRGDMENDSSCLGLVRTNYRVLNSHRASIAKNPRKKG